MAKLETWEVRLVKAMCAAKKWDDQTILAFFTRPTRSLNHREIGSIRKAEKFAAVKAATEDELAAWLAVWPDRDETTGLSLRGDELLVKAREAMVAAVSTFNSASMVFRAELYIVTCVIAWTYLCHAWLKREKIDYRYRSNNGDVVLTPGGEEKYWDLSKCLKQAGIPIHHSMKKNLEFLIEVRHEIEHRCTDRIDDALGAKLQACCLNFNECIKAMFGGQFGLERQLSMALQFVTFDPDQALGIKKASKMSAKLEAKIEAFHNSLSEEEFSDPRFGYRYAFVPLNVNKSKAADMAIDFVKPGSDAAKQVSIMLKKGEARKYRPGDVVRKMQEEGFHRFRMHNHTELRKSDEKFHQEGAGYGVDVAGSWFWYDAWVDTVRSHCQRRADQFMPDMFPPVEQPLPVVETAE